MACLEWIARTVCLALALSTTITTANPNPLPRLAMEGVTLNGGEFSGDLHESPWAGGVLAIDYTYPNTEEIDYFISKGMNAFRLPFKAANLMKPSGEVDLAVLERLVDHAALKNAIVVLDMHDYGYTKSGKLIGRDAGAVEEFAAQWAPIAARFRNKANVIFGLMCEPNKQTAAEWARGANAAIKAIRDQGAKQLILVPGTYWSGAHNWTTTDNASVIGNSIRDPGENYAFDVHQYLDFDYSGSHRSVVAGSGDTVLVAITHWARETGHKLFLGEFGFASDAASMTEGQALVDYIRRHSDVWIGSAYWGAGPWWGDYMFSVEPDDLGMDNVRDKPQMRVLKSYLEE